MKNQTSDSLLDDIYTAVPTAVKKNIETVMQEEMTQAQNRIFLRVVKDEGVFLCLSPEMQQTALELKAELGRAQ